MSGDLTDPLWGTGYGSKRHLVDGEPVMHATKGWRVARSRCLGLRLESFADDTGPSAWDARKTEAELVASRPPCARCARIAEKETP